MGEPRPPSYGTSAEPPDALERIGLVTYDVLLPVQAMQARVDVPGELRLLCAMLEDAVWIIRHRRVPYAGSARVAIAETWAWVENRSRRDLFGFEGACEAVGLDPDAVRDALRRPGHGRSPRARVATSVTRVGMSFAPTGTCGCGRSLPHWGRCRYRREQERERQTG